MSVDINFLHTDSKAALLESTNGFWNTGDCAPFQSQQLEATLQVPRTTQQAALHIRLGRRYKQFGHSRPREDGILPLPDFGHSG